MSSDLSIYYPPPGTIRYPENTIVGVVDTDDAPALIQDLKTDGATDDEIGVLTPDRRDDFEIPVEGGGIKATVKRMMADSGGDLDVVKSLRDELRPGRVLVRVKIDNDAASRDRTADSFWRHGGRRVQHLTRFRIEQMQKPTPG